MGERRLAGVEGLRAVAAAAVLLHHVQLFGDKPGGHVALTGVPESLFRDLRWGLTLFFALSGFLLFRPFAAAILSGRPLPSIRRYARNRALRILPAYWLILLITCFVLGAGAISDGDGTGVPPFGVLVADLLLVQNLSPDTVATGIGPAWSLGVEVIFYLVLPVLAVAGAAVAARRRLAGRVAAALSASGALIAVGLLSKAVLASGAVPDRWWAVGQTAMPLHADLFGYGMAAAVLHVLVADGRLVPPRWWRGAALGLAFALAAGTFAVAPHLGVERGGEAGDSVVGLACGLLLLAVCVPSPRRTRMQRTLELPAVVYAGTISYGVYLWHMPLILWLRERGIVYDGAASLLALIALTAAATLACSALTWRFVEAPALRRKRPARPVPEPEPEPEPEPGPLETPARQAA